MGIFISRETKIEREVVRVNIIMGTGASSSAIMGDTIANILPTRLQMPKAVALTEMGKSQGVAMKQQHWHIAHPNLAKSTNRAIKIAP